MAIHEEVIRMLFVVSYRKKHASSKSRKSFFAEHKEQPSQEQIQALVRSVVAAILQKTLLHFRNARDLIPMNC